ncbi:MAG: methyltransferase domain-containing protein, partial [Myxococcota bacterium]
RGDTGFLRTLTVREGKRTGDRLLALTTSTAERASMDNTEHAAEDVARAFVAAATQIFGDLGAPVTTAYWMQHHAQRGQPTRLIEHHLLGPATFREILHLPGDHELEFEIHPTAFFQPNTMQAEVLYATALEYTGLMHDEASTVLDLYCGTGTIGLCMAPYAKRVFGIELNASAVENARINAAHNGIEHAEFFVGDVGKVLESSAFRAATHGVDVIVVDPPRSGLLPQAREQLRSFDVPRLVYVSCNPETLARDAAELCAHGYTLHDVQPVDMFPHTYHIENVARFTR